MTNTELIKDIKAYSLVITESLKKNIVYSVINITVEYSDTMILEICRSLERFTVRVYEENSELFPAPTYYLEYRDGGWLDD